MAYETSQENAQTSQEAGARGKYDFLIFPLKLFSRGCYLFMDSLSAISEKCLPIDEEKEREKLRRQADNPTLLEFLDEHFFPENPRKAA